MQGSKDRFFHPPRFIAPTSPVLLVLSTYSCAWKQNTAPAARERANPKTATLSSRPGNHNTNDKHQQAIKWLPQISRNHPPDTTWNASPKTVKMPLQHDMVWPHIRNRQDMVKKRLKFWRVRFLHVGWRQIANFSAAKSCKSLNPAWWSSSFWWTFQSPAMKGGPDDRFTAPYWARHRLPCVFRPIPFRPHEIFSFRCSTGTLNRAMRAEMLCG